MKELTRFEMAIVKRTAKNTKSLRAKRDKLETKINEEVAEFSKINAAIEAFEAPIVTMTGGFTSEQILNGDMTDLDSDIMEGTCKGEIDETEVPQEKEVPAEDAVEYPEVESPLA